MNKKARILITCAKGIGPFLAGELKTLGFPLLRETPAGIETEGSLNDTMKLNLYLRTAHRVLFLLKRFGAVDANDLYREVAAMPWEDYLFNDGYFSVTSAVANPTIRDARFANVKCKDAIVDRIRAKTGVRPDSGAKTDRAVINLYWRGEEAAIYIDTSGLPLAKRGYRKIPLAAPMQETLAAAVLTAAGYGPEDNLINPMCGSGTLAIEAALIALNKAPGLLRSNFGFKHIKGFDEQAWKNMRIQARNKAAKSFPGKIIATDLDREAVAAAKKNAMTAGVDQLIEFNTCEFSQTLVPEGRGAVVINPPYGERMGDKKKLETLYQRIGDFFKNKCQGYRGCVFTANPDLARSVGLKPSQRKVFFSGPLECRFLEYDIYSGTKRQSPEYRKKRKPGNPDR